LTGFGKSELEAIPLVNRDDTLLAGHVERVPTVRVQKRCHRRVREGMPRIDRSIVDRGLEDRPILWGERRILYTQRVAFGIEASQERHVHGLGLRYAVSVVELESACLVLARVSVDDVNRE